MKSYKSLFQYVWDAAIASTIPEPPIFIIHYKGYKFSVLSGLHELECDVCLSDNKGALMCPSVTVCPVASVNPVSITDILCKKMDNLLEFFDAQGRLPCRK
jgi:hypothetical protein